MPLFTNWSDLQAKLTKEVSSTLEDEVALAVIETEKQNIEETVYSVYTPKRYKRRKNSGGLISDENFTVHKDEELSITIDNDTPANLGYNGTDKDLQELIIYGHGNPWLYDYPHPDAAYMEGRDYITATKEDLEQNKQHVQALREGLHKRGIKTD